MWEHLSRNGWVLWRASAGIVLYSGLRKNWRMWFCISSFWFCFLITWAIFYYLAWDTTGLSSNLPCVWLYTADCPLPERASLGAAGFSVYWVKIKGTGWFVASQQLSKGFIFFIKTVTFWNMAAADLWVCSMMLKSPSWKIVFLTSLSLFLTDTQLYSPCSTNVQPNLFWEIMVHVQLLIWM